VWPSVAYRGAETESRSLPKSEARASRWPLITVLGIVFAVSLLVFVYAWYTNPNHPWQGSPGYLSWSDQSSYLREANILAGGHFPSKTTYVYGIGYPIVAVPAIVLGHLRDPFAPFDGLAFATSMVMVTILGMRLRSLAFGIACTTLIIFATPLLSLTVVPWSSTVTLLVVTVLLVLATYESRWPRLLALAVGLGAGWSLAARYVDGVFPLLMTLGTTMRRRRDIALALGVVGLIGLAVLWSHWVVLGSPLTTPYAAHTGPGGVGQSDQQVGAYDVAAVPARFIGIVTGFQDGHAWPGEPLGARFFWAILAPLGVWFLFRDRHPLRVLLTSAFATSCLATIFYLSFRASGAGMLQFEGLHYFKAWFPLWALLAAYAAVRLIDGVQVPSRIDVQPN
jgi:hypothetical protein